MKYDESYAEEINDMYIYSLIKIGNLEQAILIFKNLAPKKCYSYWKCASEVAEKSNDYKTLKKCLKNQLKLADLLS